MAVNVGLNPTSFDCAHCPNDHHCDESNPHHYDAWAILFGKEVIYEGRVCPKGTMETFEMQMISDYQHYKNGILPFAGGLYDQPHMAMQCMTIIDQVYAEHGQT